MAKRAAMAVKSFWDNPFGGMFDFNRDGKEDFGELWIAQKIFEDCTKEENRTTSIPRTIFTIPFWMMMTMPLTPLGVTFVKMVQNLI